MKIFSPDFIRIGSFIAIMLPLGLKAQVVGPSGTNTNGSSSNAIVTGVPFLSISPDSRSGAMGDAGVALSPDVNANYWNPSKLAFIEGDNNLSLSYSPWLRRLVPDVALAYLSYAHKLDNRNTLGASLRYFNLGSIQLVDVNQNEQGTYRPSEFSFDVSLARKFGESFSLGLTGRYIHSSLSNGAFTSGQQTKPANAIAADVSMYYNKKTQQFGRDALFAFGADISNIGTKISYSDGGVKYFLPTNLKIGAANTWYIDDYNEFTLTFDINKLLVPTPPIRDNSGNITSGTDDNRSVVSGIFGSFSDAPGGFSEEIKEISYSPGLEYRYNKQFSLRTGYFYENPAKGDRQYLTLGAGFRYDIFNIDFSYLAANQQKSPLSNTLRFSVLVNFGGSKNANKQ
jgi:hypothetical protein